MSNATFHQPIDECLSIIFPGEDDPVLREPDLNDLRQGASRGEAQEQFDPLHVGQGDVPWIDVLPVKHALVGTTIWIFHVAPSTAHESVDGVVGAEWLQRC